MVAPFKLGGRHPKTQARVRLFYAATSFSPLSLFANGEQGAWYDPSDLSTLYQDAAGTTPVTVDGDPVGLMLDKSGNGNHASQSVAASRPVYRTDGTLHWLEFDGVDDLLTTGKSVVGGLNYFFVAGVQSQTDNYLGVVFATSGDGTISQALYLDTRSSTMRHSRVGGGVPSIFIDRVEKLDVGTKEVTSLSRSTTEATGYINGALAGTAPTSNSTGDASDFRIGNYSTIYMAGHFFGGVALNRLVTEQERAVTESYIAGKTGVTL